MRAKEDEYLCSNKGVRVEEVRGLQLEFTSTNPVKEGLYMSGSKGKNASLKMRGLEFELDRSSFEHHD